MYTCMMCHEEDDAQKMTRPCDCKTPVHDECLQAWRQSPVNRNPNQCPTCAARYKLPPMRMPPMRMQPNVAMLAEDVLCLSGDLMGIIVQWGLMMTTLVLLAMLKEICHDEYKAFEAATRIFETAKLSVFCIAVLLCSHALSIVFSVLAHEFNVLVQPENAVVCAAPLLGFVVGFEVFYVVVFPSLEFLFLFADECPAN